MSHAGTALDTLSVLPVVAVEHITVALLEQAVRVAVEVQT